MVTARLRGRQKYFSPRTGRIISAEGRLDFDFVSIPSCRQILPQTWRSVIGRVCGSTHLCCSSLAR